MWTVLPVYASVFGVKQFHEKFHKKTIYCGHFPIDKLHIVMLDYSSKQKNARQIAEQILTVGEKDV